MSSGDIPSRLPSALTADDAILPFAVETLDQRGRVVRLGVTLDNILAAHDYPLPVAKLLGEACVLAVMLGSSLKFEGRFILQTQTDGPVSMLVVDYISPGNLRACARYNATKRCGSNRGRQDIAGRNARQGPHGHDHRSRRRHEPLSGPCRARWRQRSKMRRTSISCAPNKFQPVCGLPSPKN